MGMERSSLSSDTPHSGLILLCAIGTALSGFVVFITLIVLLMGTSPSIEAKDIVLPGILVTAGAGTSLLASLQYWRRRRTGIYLHVLALVVMLPLMIVIFGLTLTTVALVVSLAIVAVMAILLKSRPAFTSLIIGLGLTCASFFYQRMGPEIGQYGTECVPIENCFGPLLGGGFPLQFVVNQPGHTSQTALDLWDELRFAPFALDFLLFAVATYGIFGLVRFFRERWTSSDEIASS
jgi:hypothetical protein